MKFGDLIFFLSFPLPLAFLIIYTSAEKKKVHWEGWSPVQSEIYASTTHTLRTYTHAHTHTHTHKKEPARFPTYHSVNIYRQAGKQDVSHVGGPRLAHSLVTKGTAGSLAPSATSCRQEKPATLREGNRSCVCFFFCRGGRARGTPQRGAWAQQNETRVG